VIIVCDFVTGWKILQVSRLIGPPKWSTSGWQGKSAAFCLAHVVDGIDILRCDVSGDAAAAWLNLKEIKAARAVNLRKWAVRHHESARK
jgi:hypothetical protein